MTNEKPEPAPWQQSRREFCKRTGTIASLTLAGSAFVALEGCSSPTSPGSQPAIQTVSATVSGRSVLVTVDASSPLATVGNAVLVQSTLGFFLVARTGASAFTALSAICTHQTCTINEFGNQTFVCPCHGSTFDTSGRVLGGPAPASLRQFATQFVGTVLTISA